MFGHRFAFYRIYVGDVLSDGSKEVAREKRLVAMFFLKIDEIERSVRADQIRLRLVLVLVLILVLVWEVNQE